MPRWTRPSAASMEDAVAVASVADVYDLAADIGKECERAIEKHGAEAVRQLMPKVICALEMLEGHAARSERDQGQAQQLLAHIQQLEAEKVERAEFRQRFERELEAIEEQWRAETNQLVTVVTRLQEENRRLAREHDKSARDTEDLEPSPDAGIIAHLRAQLDKLRQESRQGELRLNVKTLEYENVKSQLDRSAAANKDMKRKQRSMQAQMHSLCDERADILVQLQDQQRDLMQLRRKLGIAQKENEDLSDTASADDPNRPRFTTQELRDLLNERNELKTRLNELEDELAKYRPQQPAQEPPEEDAPVQGPMPYEPEDAPWRRSESRVRKFFWKIFSDGAGPSSVSSFPRRTLTKITGLAE